MRELVFPSGGRELTGRLFDSVRGGATRRAVLFVHGQGSSQESYKHRAEVASASLEAVCLTFNLSGHGKDIGDSGEYSVIKHLDDVIAAFDLLASHPAVDRTRIGVCGASYGAYLAALLTAHRNFRRLILRAPSLVIDNDSPNPYTAQAEAKYELDSLKTLAAYGGRTLILQSEKDEVIPESYIVAYLGANSQVKLEVIPEALHALINPVWNREFIRHIVKWFKDM
jgi:uncharacterized protein